MKTCLNGTTIRQGLDLETFLGVAGKAGFEGVEFSITSVSKYAEENSLSSAKALFTKNNLQPANFGIPASLFATDEEFEADLKELPKYLKLAQELGCSVGMVVLPFRTEIPVEEMLSKIVEKLRKIADIANDYEIGVALEFIGLRFEAKGKEELLTNLEQTIELIKEIDKPNVGALIDSYHWFTGGSKLEDLDRISGDKLLFFHINDAPDKPVEELTDPMRVLPGRGVIDLVGLLKKVKSKDYEGFVSVELFSEELRKEEPLEAAKKSKMALDEVLKQV